MKNTILLTKMARSMLIAGLVLGITGAAYAQVGAGGVVGGVESGTGGVVGGVEGGAVGGGAGMGVGGSGMAGQTGSQMPGMDRAMPGLEQNSLGRERDVPGLGSSDESRGVGGSAAGLNSPSGMERSSGPRY